MVWVALVTLGSQGLRCGHTTMLLLPMNLTTATLMGQPCAVPWIHYILNKINNNTSSIREPRENASLLLLLLLNGAGNRFLFSSETRSAADR